MTHVRRRIGQEAYELYMRGRVHQERFTPEDFTSALRYYQAALDREPDYAPAHAGAAMAWGSRIMLGLIPPLEAGPQMREHGERAVALDPDLAEAHHAMAGYYTWYAWDWASAEASFKRAIELDPNDAQIRTFYSHFLSMMRRPDEALVQGERALTIDPINPFHRTMYGVVLLHARRWSDAEAELGTALEMVPGNALAHLALGIAQFHEGRLPDAMRSWTKYFRVIGDEDVAEALRGGDKPGEFADASWQGAEILVARSREMYVQPTMIWSLFDWAGDIDSAMAWIEKGIELKDHSIAHLAANPYSDVLVGDPRYQAVLRRVGLAG